MKARRKWQGMWTIVRLNWPFYLAVALALIVSAWVLGSHSRLETKLIAGLALAGSLYFLLVSLGVSHAIYDQSGLYRWSWLPRALTGASRKRMAFCHSGFDESSASLRASLGDGDWCVLDHFDERRMTEASIRRARRLFPPVAGTLAAAFDHWPVASDSFDVVFGLLAIHELRSEVERSAWFTEARRCLRNHGRVVLVEHVRDWANFLAFGPGFLHFHSPGSWRRCWERAGLRAHDEFRLTPWLRVWVLTPP